MVNLASLFGLRFGVVVAFVFYLMRDEVDDGHLDVKHLVDGLL